MTRVLGAVLAGGASQRFGSDKALAMHDGRALIDHAIARLGEIADAVVVSGGSRPGYASVPDAPAPGLGPLGGLCGAMTYAAVHGLDAVLTIPCDTPDLPVEALRRLKRSARAAYLAALPVAGYWPITLHADLIDQLSGDDRSMRGWARRCGAFGIATASIVNINRPSDLTALAKRPDTADR